nr:MAG TPA: Protein of unknown function (DUF1492) [Bacteriophage sp.]DAM59125.1 MAG TPA: Protein of unknown function (DUF1492) [Caudoviricetes sp.]DAP12578.1 MAG TPA: Protein of unknown function (DUF1492) [Caudoviricetes sp.]
MTTRQYLSQIEKYDNLIHNKIIEEEQLNILSMSVKSIPIGEKVQTSSKQDPMGDMVAKIIDLREEISKMATDFLEQKQEIIRTIETVEDPILYDVLFKRYVEYKTLLNIADELGYSEVTIKRLHLKAVKAIKNIKGFES